MRAQKPQIETMLKLIKVLGATLGLLWLSACQNEPISSDKPEWGQTLDLCQLAAWRTDAHPEIRAACTGSPEADAVLLRRLSLRQQCLAENDFSACTSRTVEPSPNPSLDRARRLAFATNDQFSDILVEAIDDDDDGRSRRRVERLEGWKKELDENGLLKDKYANQIGGFRWGMSMSDWLAYHAFSAENSDNPNHQLVSQVTLATSLAELGLFEEAAKILSKIGNEEMDRVLRPDWSLYSSKDISFDSENASFEERSVWSRFRKTVGGVFSIQLYSDNKNAAIETLAKSRATLVLMGDSASQHVEMMEFLLGKVIPKNVLFDKLFFGPSYEGRSYARWDRNGLYGWESIADATAMAPLLERHLIRLDPKLTGYSLSVAEYRYEGPNMSDPDFLQQSAELRDKMVYYKNLLEERVRKESFDEIKTPTVAPPSHVSFMAQENEAKPVDENLLSRIRAAGIGTYGVSAARELPNGLLQIIYLSGAIDPSGETGIEGYWLLEGNLETGKWEDPFYLGFRNMMPYIVDGFVEGNIESKSLQLMGARAPLDLGSVTFPPIMMNTAKPERGLITIDITAVKRDSDGDTLTDLFETRTGLNPANPDTDGDLIRDNRDSVPTRTYKGSSRDRERAFALLSILEGHEDGAIVQAPAPPDQERDMFSGLQLNTDTDDEYAQYRDPIPGVLYFESEFEGFGLVDLDYMLIVQTETESEAMSQAFAPHYPIRITRQIVDPYSDRMIVVWSAGWVGGTVLLTRQPDGGYKHEILSSWIS